MSLTRKNTLKTMFWSGFSTLQFFLKNIFFISLFIKFHSGQDYGFWIILASFYGMVVYVCEGYVRYCLNEFNLEYYRDPILAHKYFSNGFSFLFLVSVIIMALMLAGVFYLPLSAALFNTSAAVVQDKSLHFCLLIIMLLSLVQCIVRYISGAIEPGGNIHITNRYMAIYYFSETAVYFLCLFFAVSIIGIFLSALVVLTVINAIFLYSILRKHKIYKLGLWGNVKEGTVLFTRSLFFIANNFFEKLAADGVNFMVAIFYPLAALLPSYASTRTMGNVMVSTGNTVISIFMIEYQRLSIRKEAERLMKILHAVWLLLGVSVNFGLVCAYPLLIRIYTLWTHGKFAVNIEFFYIIFSVVVLNVYGAVIIFYLKSLNSIRGLLAASILRAVLVLLLVVLFPRQPIYLALSLLIAEFIVNTIFLNVLFYKQMLKLDGKSVWAALFWNMLPFLLTAAFLPVNGLLHIPYIEGTSFMVVLLSIVYAIQIRYMKNDFLSDNLKLAKAKIFDRGSVDAEV